MGALIALAVLLGSLSYGHCVELTQPGYMTVNPGQSLTISCKVSGYSLTDSSYATGWIRQPAGKALEWIGYMSGGGSLYYKDSLKSKFTISRDTSSNTVTLEGSSLQTADTAAYYCTRQAGPPSFDYWGKGTHVTVTQDTPSPPTTLFSVMAREQEGPTDQLTLACIAGGFLPSSSVTFQWKNTSGKPVSDFTEYPAVQISGSKFYTSVSHLRVNEADWDAKKTYSCSVNYLSQVGVKDASFQKPAQCSDTPCLGVTLNPPKARELFENNQAVLDCVITGGERAAVEGAKVTWTPSGTDTSSIESQTTPHGHLFRKTSTLTFERKRWFSEQNVQCSVQQKNSKKPAIKKSFSRNSASKVPKVVIITPSEEDSEFVSLVCVVTGFSPRDVFVMWTVDGSYEEGVTSEPVESKHGTFSVASFLEVPTAKWKSQSLVNCNVVHISMSNGATPTTKSVSRATGNSIECD